jgi:hypothetical protein
MIEVPSEFLNALFMALIVLSSLNRSRQQSGERLSDFSPTTLGPRPRNSKRKLARPSDGVHQFGRFGGSARR